MRKYKNAKRSTPKVYSEFVEQIHSVVCPFCKTTIVGGVSKSYPRMFCSYCKNEIILDWEKVK